MVLLEISFENIAFEILKDINEIGEILEKRREKNSHEYFLIVNTGNSDFTILSIEQYLLKKRISDRNLNVEEIEEGPYFENWFNTLDQDPNLRHQLQEMTERYDKLSTEISIEYMKDWEVALNTFKLAILKNLDIVSPELIDLLITIFDIGEKERVFNDLTKFFNKLPESFRNEKLFNLGKNDFEMRGYFIDFVAKNFYIVDKKAQDLFLELINEERHQNIIASILASNFDKLPDSAKEVLKNILEKESNIKPSVYTILYNLEKLPEYYKNLVFQLARKNKDVAKYINEYQFFMNREQEPTEEKK